MAEVLATYFSIYILSMVKFIAGPLTGFATGTGILETCIFTVLGMMTSVILFSYFGKFLRERFLKKWFVKKKKFSKKSRRFVTIWKRYGLFGIAFLTPVLFSPIGGAVLISSLGGMSHKRKIFSYMLFSASFWSVVYTTLIHQVKYLELSTLF